MAEKFKCNKIISYQNLHIICRRQKQILLQSWIRLAQAPIQYVFSNYLSVPSQTFFDPSRSLCWLSSFERTWPYGEAQRSAPNPCHGAALSPCEPWPLRPLSRGWCDPCLTHTIPVTTEDLETSVLNALGGEMFPQTA